MAEVDLARAKEIFGEALERGGKDRTSYLDIACAGDPAMRSRVEVLLRAAELDDPFLSGATLADHGFDVLSDGAPGDPEKAPVPAEGPGTRIGPYRLLQQIGEGGFGAVFMAEQERPVRRRVALKIIKLGMDTRAVVARFEQERQALAVLDHPHIAKVLDAGATETGRPYFVMELVKGEPINEYCDARSLTIRERLELFAQVCQAVQHAHTKGIIHRDLKPSNVLVSEVDGRASAKVIDFGIAKATQRSLTEKTFFTEFQQIIGTPEYMSPEQAGGSLDIDTRTDVYSLGVLLYELVTGTTPFDARALRSAAYAELQRIIREVDPPKPSTRLSESAATLTSVAARRRVEPRRLGTLVRGELDWIVMKAMDKDRARRYESPSGLAADVLRHLAGEAVGAAPPTAAYRLRKFVRRNRGTVIAASLVALALTAGAAAAVIGLVEARAASAREKQQAQEARVLAGLAETASEREREQAKEARRQTEIAKEAGEREKVQAEKARRQAAIAGAANSFLNDMLEKANRGEQGGNPDVTVREVLDAADADLRRAKVEYDPEVLASVHDTIGRTYLGIGLYEKAEPHLRDALKLAQQLHGEKDSGTALRMRTLAEMLYLTDRIDEAEGFARRATAIDTELLGPDSPEAANDRAAIGLALAGRRDYLKAEQELEAALAILRKSPGDQRKAIATILTNLGLVVQKKMDIDRAESVYTEALALQRELDGPESVKVTTILNNLAWIHSLKREYDKAEAMYREVIDMRRRLLGPDHPLLAMSINNLGGMLQAKRDLDGAEAAFREALDIRTRRLTENHPQTIGSIENLASLLQDKGRFDDAEILYNRSLALRRKVLGDNDPDTADSLGNLASLKMARGKIGEAEQLLREALAIRRKVASGAHPDTASSLVSLAVVLAKQEKYIEAVALVRESLAMRRELAGDGNAETILAKSNLGLVLIAKGDYQEAEPILREAAEECRNAIGPENPRTIACTSALGLAISELAWRDRGTPDALKRAEEGERLLKESLDLRAKKLAPTDLTLALNKNSLGAAIVTTVANRSPEMPASAAIERLRTAETFLTESYEVISAIPRVAPSDLTRLRLTVERLARLHEVWETIEPGTGHAEKSAQWRAKLS